MLNRTSSSGLRDGTTVVEVLVALVILSIGLLGVAGTCALATRTAAAARRERHAIARAASRAARLTVHGCGQPAAGSADDDGVSERWDVTPVSPVVAMLDVRVGWDAQGGPRLFALASAVLC